MNLVALPEKPVMRIVRPMLQFLTIEATSGVALLRATSIALVISNSPLAGAYADLWATPMVLSV